MGEDFYMHVADWMKKDLLAPDQLQRLKEKLGYERKKQEQTHIPRKGPPPMDQRPWDHYGRELEEAKSKVHDLLVERDGLAKRLFYAEEQGRIRTSEVQGLRAEIAEVRAMVTRSRDQHQHILALEATVRALRTQLAERAQTRVRRVRRLRRG